MVSFFDMFAKYSIGINFLTDRAIIVCLEGSFLPGIKIKCQTQILFDPKEPFTDQVEKSADKINAFLETNQIDNADVHIGFPNHLAIMRQLEFPSAAKDDIRSTVSYSLDNYVPIKIEDLYFDCQILAEDKKQKIVKTLVCAAKKKDVNPFINLAASLITGVSSITVNAAGIMNFAYKNGLIENDPFYLFFSHDSQIDIIHFKNNLFEYSKQLNADNSSHIELIEKELETGMAGNNVHAVCFSDHNLASEYKRMNPSSMVDFITPGMGGNSVPSNSHIPGFGLGLCGLIHPQISLNLLPEIKRKRASRLQNNIMYSLLVITLLLAITWAGSYIMHRRVMLTHLNSELVRLKQEVIEIEGKKEEISFLEKKIDSINLLKSEQIFAVEIIDELSKIIPPGTWINDFSFDLEKGLKIKGYSNVSSDLIPIIEESALFKDAVFLSPIVKTSDGNERFNIGFELDKYSE